MLVTPPSLQAPHASLLLLISLSRSEHYFPQNQTPLAFVAFVWGRQQEGFEQQRWEGKESTLRHQQRIHHAFPPGRQHDDGDGDDGDRQLVRAGDWGVWIVREAGTQLARGGAESGVQVEDAQLGDEGLCGCTECEQGQLMWED